MSECEKKHVKRFNPTAPGALGSILLHGSQILEDFFGMARSPSKEIWEAAQRTMPLLNLQGLKPDAEYFFDELVDIKVQRSSNKSS